MQNTLKCPSSRSSLTITQSLRKYLLVSTLLVSPLAAAEQKPNLNEQIKKIEGVYKRRFPNELTDGHKFTSENILEVVRMDASAIYFKTHLEAYNAHQCELAGIAQGNAEGGFVYMQPNLNEGEIPCELTISIKDKDLTITDPNGECRMKYCGARASFDDESFPLSSRKPIRYMPVILKSEQYVEAVANYTKTK